MNHRISTTRVSAVLLSAALVAPACGGSDDDDSAEEPATSTPVEVDADEEPREDVADEPTEDPASTEPATDEADDVSNSEVDEQAAGDAAAAPVRGGSMTFLLEAETDTWDIPSAQCAASCLMVMHTVADTLTMYTADGTVEPFLLESYSTNDDFTVHTLTMRDGVMFHDGTPADGAALQRNLVEMANGLLIGGLLVDLENGVDSIVQVDDMTVEVTFSRPFSTFGRLLADRPGWLLAPSFWDDPDRRSAFPIATGAFRMTEWLRGERTVVEANPSYWRSGADGQPLPYLDDIIFRPIPDNASRRVVMEAGDADASHDGVSANIEYWTTEWDGELVEPSLDQDASYLLFNLAAPPFDDPELRRALALCTDREEYLLFLAPGATIAEGPFSPGSLGHVPDPGFPAFDPEAGNALLDEIGRPDVIRYSTTTDSANLLAAEFFATMWSTNCGLTVDIDQFDQAELITRALTADFGILRWRNHGRGHPGLEIHTWHSRHATGLATNVGRLTDAEIDQLLYDALATDDPAQLDAIGQSITEAFADNAYAMWLYHNLWSVPYRDRVNGIGVRTAPSGSVAPPSGLGSTWLTEAWVDE